MLKPADLQDLVGKKLSVFESEAKSRGVGCVRVVQIDDKTLPITKDMRRDRLNVAVKTQGGNQIVSEIRRFA